MIKAQHVLVNSRGVRPSYLLEPDDRIDLTIPDPEPTDIQPQALDLAIIYEDEDLLVINKPVGMVVHPAAGHWEDTLVNALLYHCGDQLSGIGGEIKPGIVHRLDKETSGLLLVAKTDQAHQHLSAQLKSRTLYREYHALLWGVLNDEQGTIDAAIGRHPNDRKRMIVAPRGRRREAITHFTIIERFEMTTYARVKLETGRTHQIRVHFQHIHHPVIGDPVYGGRETYVSGLWHERQPLAHRILKHIDHQALHARKISFIHPRQEKTLSFETELPSDFKNVLSFLRELH